MAPHHRPRSLDWPQLSLLRVITVCGAVAVTSGCDNQSGNARDLAVSSAREARTVVELTLTAVANSDVDGAIKAFCDQSPAGVERTRELLAPFEPSGVDAAGESSDPEGTQIERVEAAWVGMEPYFYVEVQSAAGFRHGFGVRVRTGCLERAVGATSIDPATMTANPIDDAADDGDDDAVDDDDGDAEKVGENEAENRGPGLAAPNAGSDLGGSDASEPSGP